MVFGPRQVRPAFGWNILNFCSYSQGASKASMILSFSSMRSAPGVLGSLCCCIRRTTFY